MEAKVENIVHTEIEMTDTLPEPVHVNDNYAVYVGGPEIYHVINLKTEVVEFKDSQLANAVGYAEHGNSFIVNELWKWVAVQGEKNKEALNKESTVVEFESELEV